MLRLFVGNIPHIATEEDLRRWFRSEGFETDNAQILRDRMTGHSRGFGFIDVQTNRSVEDLAAALSGHLMSGRPLTVNGAKPRSTQGHADRAVGGG